MRVRADGALFECLPHEVGRVLAVVRRGGGIESRVAFEPPASGCPPCPFANSDCPPFLLLVPSSSWGLSIPGGQLPGNASAFQLVSFLGRPWGKSWVRVGVSDARPTANSSRGVWTNVVEMSGAREIF